MEKYNKYKITTIPTTMEEICYPKNKKYELLPQQKFLSEYLFDNIENLSAKGLLVYHGIGSGKTCTAISIAEKFKNNMKIVVVVPASLIGNFKDELRSACGNYLSEEDKDIIKTLNPTDDEYIKIINKSNEEINKYYNIYSYHKFTKDIERTRLKLDNTLLIIDEVQNMVSISGTFYKILKNAINKSDDKTKLILLSATPIFDNPVEIALTLNLLRPKNLFPIDDNFEGTFLLNAGNYYKSRNMELFKDMCKGLVSYFKGALPISYPKTNFEVIRCNMSNHQLEIYKIARKKELMDMRKKKIKRITFPTNFLIGSRIVSNIAYPNGLSDVEGYESLYIDAMQQIDPNDIKQYSCKFVEILKNINKATGPIFIYSNFLNYGGLKPFIKYLESNGFKNFNKHNIGTDRFAVYSGDETLEQRDIIKKYYNDYNNKNGEQIKILLGSPSTKEGISLLRVNQVHILEPHWNLSRIKQIIGRAIRYCSHKDMPENDRYVNVYLYLAIHPELKLSTDEYIWSIAKKKDVLIKSFETALKEVAIDCELFNKVNNINNKFTCH